MGLCVDLKQPQHFLTNQCSYKGVSLLKEVFRSGGGGVGGGCRVLFCVASQWNTKIHARRIIVATILFLCVKFWKAYHYYNLRRLIVQVFCLGKGLVRLLKKTWLCCGS